ncbi:hypothetical protein [Metabacillus fastidiosus]|uniref:hypothetical protein n=1 Tax=Metabacillus fastidiosus TaxID=1458 RepID=UPI002E1D0B84|nr:hypothetical protein [Metabacillus fastidiosus]
MIINRVSYAGEFLITVLHGGIEDEDYSYERKIIKEKINRNNLVFEQFIVNDDVLNNLGLIIATEEGFLTPNDDLNIYSGNVCARMIRYVSGVKPSKIIKTLENKFEFKLSTEIVIKINEFIKKYTGIDLNANPIFYGDTFIFEPIELDFSKNDRNGINIKNIEMNSQVIIKFKRNGLIVHTHKRAFETDMLEIEMNSDVEWTSFDIEVYRNNELIYFNYDISYIESINLTMNVVNRPKNVKLNQLASSFEIPSEPSTSEIMVGEELNFIEELYSKSNFEMSRQIKLVQEEGNITFIKPGETSLALKMITNFLNKSFKELWIFDPYFTDKSRFTKTLDWLRIFFELPSRKINIVYYCKSEDKAFDSNSIKAALIQDPVIDRTFKNKTISCTFIETNSPIHDRFILGELGNNKFSGMTIGTSLNSVDSNHFCINYINHTSTKSIFNELNNYLNDGNIVGQCTI